MTTLAVLAVLALSGPVQEPEPVDRLADPVRLEADGQVIDISEDIAYAGPWVTDYDGDSKADLIVTGISGHLRLFRNVSDGPEPVYRHVGLEAIDAHRRRNTLRKHREAVLAERAVHAALVADLPGLHIERIDEDAAVQK